MTRFIIISFYIFLSSILIGQNTNEDCNNISIYEFLDELASCKIIELNSCIKPYSRKLIQEKLLEAELKDSLLTKFQIDDLNFYKNAFKLQFNNINNTVDIDLYRKDSSMSVSINPFGFNYQSSDFKIEIKPIWGIRYYTNDNNNIRHTWGGAEFNSQIGDNLNFYASLRDNYQTNEILSSPTYFTQQEGGNYKLNEGGRKGGDYSEMRGGIIYNYQYGSISLLKDNIQWGDNYNGSNIFSGRTPSFTMLKLNLFPVKWIEFNYIHGTLISEVIDSSRSYVVSQNYNRVIFRNKFIAANMYTLKPLKNLYFSFGNSIVYSDNNFQISYLIPFSFFKSIDHTINHDIENQNSQMFFNLSSRQIKRLHIYSSLFVDEFKKSRIFVDSLHNFISSKLGFAYSFKRFKFFPISRFVFEYTKTSPITYKHRVESTTFESNKYNLGHYLRDNSKELFLSIQFKPISRLKIDLNYIYAIHGNEYVYFDGNKAVAYPVLDEITWQNKSKKIGVSYQFTYNSFIYIDYLISKINAFDIDGNSKQYYLNLFTPQFLQGNNNTLSIGFNIGF